MNELNSIMVLNEHPDGTLTGKYRSMVGRDLAIRDLCGRTSAVEEGKQMLGFVVCFQIDDPRSGYGHYSLCTWSGWERAKKIRTHWLLTIGLLKKEDEWSSTTVGVDSFEKVLDVPEETHLGSDTETLKRLLAKGRT